MDDKIINFLETISNSDVTSINELIKKEFPDIIKKGTKNYLKYLSSFAINNTTRENLEGLLVLLNKIYSNNYTNMASLDVKLSSEIRKPIIDKYGRFSEEHELSKKLVKISYEDKGKVIEKAQVSLEKLQSSIIEVNQGDIIKIIKNNYKSDNPFDRAIALLLASGSRPIELFDKTITYKKIDKYIEQSNIAKQRDTEKSVVKPILGITVNQFIKSREQLLNQEYDNNKLNESSRKLLGLNAYSTRKIYGALSYKLHGHSTTLNYYLSKVLGHEGLNTANHYTNFKVVRKNKNKTSEL